MTDIGSPLPRFWPTNWLTRLVARPSFQDWVNRTPGLSRIARKDGAELFGIVQGFVRAQTLFAMVQLDIPRQLMSGPMTADDLGQFAGLSTDRMALLLKAASGIGIVKRRRDASFALTRQGAALVGVPGLQDMILHHGAFYRDMADPVGLLAGDRETELSAFWPYVFGAGGATDPAVTDRYSNLMAETQAMVARDTLQAVSLKDVSCLMDVGGGSGAFLIEAGRQHPNLEMVLFDLPAVMPSAKQRVASAGMANRITLAGGSFRDDALPDIGDAVSLVRVLYDHSDDTVKALLRRVHDALPTGGRLIISEPMSGGAEPDAITDVYFAFYTLAMRTGRTRSSAEIAELVRGAGFKSIQTPRTPRSFVTSVLTAVRD